MKKRITFNGEQVLFKNRPVTFDINNVFFGMLDLYSHSYDRSAWEAEESKLPIEIHTGYSIFPFAYTSGFLLARDNNNGNIIDIPFERQGAGWSMMNGSIFQSGDDMPRLDNGYYNTDLGYLIEGANTNTIVDSKLATEGSVSGDGTLYRPLNINDNFKIIEGVANASRGFQNTSGFIANSNNYFIRIIAKKNLTRNIRYVTYDSVSGYLISILYLNDGTFVDGHGEIQSKESQSHPDCWEFSVKIPNITNYGIWRFDMMTTNENYQGDGHSFIEVVSVDSFTNFDSRSPIITSGSAITRPAEIISLPLSTTSDIWIKSDQGVQIINDVPSGMVSLHDYIPNGKLLGVIVPLRNFTAFERSMLNA